MNGIVKKIVSILLLFVIAGLVYANIKSIMQPINFNKQKEYRETVGIQRMKASVHFRRHSSQLQDTLPLLLILSLISIKTARWKSLCRSVQTMTLLQ